MTEIKIWLFRFILCIVLFAPAVSSWAQEFRLPPPEISEDNTLPSNYVDVLDSFMHYIDVGEGDPILLLHGNPTSSYLWRNIIPFLSEHGRVIAPDLIGMGQSGKPDIDYRFKDHYQYLNAFIKRLGIKKNITIVGHDWGAALGFNFARLNRQKVKQIAFMEGALPPTFPSADFSSFGEAAELFQAFRDPVIGPQLIIGQNAFVEQVLPMAVNRRLGDVALDTYRAPYLLPADRLPTLVWPNELPIAGEPVDMFQVFTKLERFMRKTTIPKLLLYVEPGNFVPAQVVDWYIENLNNLETVFVGQGFHFMQEDNPVAIGRALADWLRRQKKSVRKFNGKTVKKLDKSRKTPPYQLYRKGLWKPAYQ